MTHKYKQSAALIGAMNEGYEVIAARPSQWSGVSVVLAQSPQTGGFVSWLFSGQGFNHGYYGQHAEKSFQIRSMNPAA